MRSFVELGSDEKLSRPAPAPMRSPTMNLVRFVLVRILQVWVNQSTPDGKARVEMRDICQKGLRELKPVRYVRSWRSWDAKYPMTVPEHLAHRRIWWWPILSVSQ